MTIFLAAEIMDEADHAAALAQVQSGSAPFIDHLEVVLQSHFAPAMLNAVQEAAILKVADAQIALYAVQVLTGILAGAAGTLEDPPDMDAALQTQAVLNAALEAIQS
jgi:hypothetical protein